MSTLTRPTVTTLLPGEVALGERGDRLETLLGSCVAIVLTDPRRTLGVMCHIMHSRHPPLHAHHDTAFAAAALRRMCELLVARGIAPALCEAYLYGGGDMFPHLPQTLSVGDDNAEWAVSALEAMGVRICALDLGGTCYRRLAWTVGPDEPEVTALPVPSAA